MTAAGSSNGLSVQDQAVGDPLEPPEPHEDDERAGRRGEPRVVELAAVVRRAGDDRHLRGDAARA